MGKPSYVVWEGRKPVADIDLIVDVTRFRIPADLAEERDRIWSFLTHFDPHQYNGLLFFSKIPLHPSREFPKITLQPITYKDFKTLQYAHRNFPPLGTDYETEVKDPSAFTRSGPEEEESRHSIFQDFSALCCVYLITNPQRTHVLVGKREEVGGWGDGYFACPGGILEWSQIQGIRRVTEEANMDMVVPLSTEITKDLLLSELDEEVNAEFDIKGIDVVGITDGKK